MRDLIRLINCLHSIYGVSGVIVYNRSSGIRMRRLERENDRLLKIVGQQRLEIEGMREVLAKKH